MTESPNRLSKDGIPIAQTIRLAGVKKLIAAHMTQCHSQIPSVTIMEEFDVDALVSARNTLNLAAGEGTKGKISYTHLVIKAVSLTLRDYPRLNSTLNDQEIQVLDQINIGMAVSLPDGDLIVPVIKDADRKSLQELASEATRLAEDARHGRLRPPDVRGATFTVTNIGMLPETRWQTPLINLPQCAILATGAVRQAPVVRQGAITIGNVMSVSLSFDHRIVSGLPAAHFLKALASSLSEAGSFQ
jgi:pyruvate/2-oxoglutarate dehydrogenase complex dihydrolipoamide acyltransferase (E2) component